MRSGEPTIVAVYVRHEYRSRGYGNELLIAAINRCRERGLVPVRIDVMTTPVKKIIEHLPEDYRRDLHVVDAIPAVLEEGMDQMLLA